jgi:hypothetical protein
LLAFVKHLYPSGLIRSMLSPSFHAICCIHFVPIKKSVYKKNAVPTCLLNRYQYGNLQARTKVTAASSELRGPEGGANFRT